MQERPLAFLQVSKCELSESSENLREKLNCTKIGELQMGKIIGTGNYAIVRIATHSISGKKVAVKTYETAKLYDMERKKSVANESKIMKGLEHSNIISFIAHLTSPGKIHLVMEYPGLQSLYEYVKNGQNRHISIDQARPIFFQLTNALNYLHSRSISHRDIKLENVMFNKGVAKLIDFGFSFSGNVKQRTYCGTPTYMAPELVNRKEYSPSPVDVWALGVLLFRMISGTYPFKAKTERELFKRISLGEYDDSCIPCPEARDLLSRMLVLDPSKRLTTTDIMDHSFYYS